MGLALLTGDSQSGPDAQYQIQAVPAQVCVCSMTPRRRLGTRRCSQCGGMLQAIPTAERIRADELRVTLVPTASGIPLSPLHGRGADTVWFDAVSVCGRPLFAATTEAPQLIAGVEDETVVGGVRPVALPPPPGSHPRGRWLGFAAADGYTPLALLCWEDALWVHNILSEETTLVWSSPSDVCIRRPALAARWPKPSTTDFPSFWAAAPIQSGARLSLEIWRRNPSGRWELMPSSADRQLIDGVAGQADAQAALVTSPTGDGFDWWSAEPAGSEVLLHRTTFRISEDGTELHREARPDPVVWRPPGGSGEGPVLDPLLSMTGSRHGEMDDLLLLSVSGVWHVIDLLAVSGVAGVAFARLSSHVPTWWRRWPERDGRGACVLSVAPSGHLEVAGLGAHLPAAGDRCHLVMPPGLLSNVVLSAAADEERALEAHFWTGERTTAVELGERQPGRRFVSAVAAAPHAAWALAVEENMSPRQLNLFCIDQYLRKDQE